MKKLVSTLTFLLCVLIAIAQSPESFNYQGVARDNAGNVLANQNVGLKFSILDGGANVEYSEDWSVTTNGLGLFNVELGGGNYLSGNFSSIDWGSGPYYVKVEMDPAGGTAYQNLGTSQLLSVPYALYAETSGGELPSGATGNTLRHNGTDWEPSSDLTNFGSYVNVSGELNVGSNQGHLYSSGANFNIEAEANLKLRTGGGVYDVSIYNGSATTPFVNFEGNTESVGIGTSVTDPIEKLEVNGNIALSGSSRSIIAPDGAFNIESTTGVDVIIDSDNNSTNSSFRVKRNSDGSEIIMEVKESGDVEVEGEYVYASSKTHYQSFSWNSFISVFPQNYEFGQAGSSTVRYGEFVSGSSGLGYAVAPLSLPDGALVTEIRAWIWDNDSGTPVRVRFYSQPLGSETATLISTVESASATAMSSVQELFIGTNTTVDNATNSYFLRFAGKQASGDTRLYGVRNQRIQLTRQTNF